MKLSEYIPEKYVAEFFETTFKFLKQSENKLYGLEILKHFVKNTQHDYFAYMKNLTEMVIPFLADENPKIVECNKEVLYTALQAFDIKTTLKLIMRLYLNVKDVI
jgi:hypothetical protein